EGQIWVRSKLNANKEVYYRLKKPAAEYARYYYPFLWVADLAKHAVDFSAWMIERGRQVDLRSFKEPFIRWLLKTHGGSPSFQRWRRKHPSDDYRASVSANIEFIWKEINGVLGIKKALSLQIFRELIHFSQYKRSAPPQIPMIVRGEEREPATIVTPYIKECFGHMTVGKMLRAIDGSSTMQLSRRGTWRPRNPRPVGGGVGVGELLESAAKTPSSKAGRRGQARFLPYEVIDQIKAGDTISTPRDGDATDTKWRSMTSKGAADDGRWFGLVQKVHIAADGSRSFDVTWFYRPVETPCCMMKYPWPKELFLSDHCTCEEGRHARVKEHEVLAVHDIDWLGNPNGLDGEFFVRQTYIVEDRRWVTLQKSHMTCSHGRARLGFKTGDTVLAAIEASRPFSEPYEVVKIFKQGKTTFVRLRRLLRRSEVDPGAYPAPNELVYTEQLIVAKPDKIVGKCLVRFFRPGEPIPTPYDRGGTGNLFYVTHRLQGDGDNPRCVPFDNDIPPSFRQGFDPTNCTTRKLKGMDLFCGSGNFGRGLEEGGAVEMRWANDIWDKAVHTYMANSPEPGCTSPFLGSVDDLLRLALEGRYSDNVPRPGEVDFISAGSPCPGFSLLTQDKTTLAQIKNQSLVASFASFVDFYRPKYGVLENVSSIVQARRNRAEDVLSQLLCAIVGMGYQAQLILGDSWSHGAPQSRNRVFLYFAAPGLRLPDAPALSHSHFPGVSSRGLGEMCNGEAFVRRTFQPTPFKYVSAREGTADLPRIGDSKAGLCIPFPDHRVCTGITGQLREQIAAIPTHPYGMDFVKSWRNGEGVMTAAERAAFPADGSFRVSSASKAWRRVRPNEVFQTITTQSRPTDARAGTGLHWYEDRPLTVQEIRRAQGFPDHEVLLGTTADQWKLVGNSVARQMALALGLKLREAWVGTLYEDGGRASREASESAEPATATVLRQAGIYGSTPRSRSTSITPMSETDSSAGRMTTPASVSPETAEARPAKPAGMRKRLFSQALVTDRPLRKTPRLESRESTPASDQPTNSTMMPTSRTELSCVPTGVQEENGGQAPAVWTGPTVVRLPELDELEADW
ncbi:DNA (cytosine-5)-methyltransferase 1, partial [Madurella mycetomatis]